VKTVKTLTDRGVRLTSTTDGIDSSITFARMMIRIMGPLAEDEGELIKERIALKRASCRVYGTKLLPRKVHDSKHIATRMRQHGLRPRRRRW
jgi:DNA invertase Pin-like site-specific DNA recombinase